MQQFTHSYSSLEPGKFFFTIWVGFPKEVTAIVKDTLSPIRKYCEWMVGTDEDRLVHITLRYLGYASEQLEQQILHDQDLFVPAVKNFIPLTITLSDFTIFKNEQGQLRLNWKIKDGNALSNIHKELLKIKGYAFFENLEGYNYHPHINIGKADLTIPNAETEIEKFLQSLPQDTYQTSLTDIEINFSGIDKGDGPTKAYQLPLIKS